MDSNSSVHAQPPRGQHGRNNASKSNLLRALVSSKPGPASPDASTQMPWPQKSQRTKSVPLLPADHPHVSKARALGDRQGNIQSPPSSPSRSRQKTTQVPVQDAPTSPKKSKSSTNLAAVFAKMNRSSKDLSSRQPRDKENTTPPSSSHGSAEAPIWAQFVAAQPLATRPSTRDSKSSNSVQDEIAKYTPTEYSPSKQRNFNGTLEQPTLRPTLSRRPQSAYLSGVESISGTLGRRFSGDTSNPKGRTSEDVGGSQSMEHRTQASTDKPAPVSSNRNDRKVSGSNTEQGAKQGILNIAKRGGRVMAAVAALQGKGKAEAGKMELHLDPGAVDKAFETVLESRNIPEPMRQKMRSLTLSVKADFIKQDKGSNMADDSPEGVSNPRRIKDKPAADVASVVDGQLDGDGKATKRSRPRSRTFTFSKGDKRSDASPSKKQRSQSKSRPASIHVATDTLASTIPTTPTSPTASIGRKTVVSAAPAEYISYLRKQQDLTVVEVGRLHKLRILLRNETIAWVDSFVLLGGMTEIVGLLHRIMAVEWREEHEDQLLHETLLCLKGLCTTERGMSELHGVADALFPALLAMLFDDEKKGPAEYTTRTIIINVLFNFLTSATHASSGTLEQRATKILAYLGEPSKPETDRPVEFVLHMHVPRPYKLWSREITHVTKEVFWIFLHHLNVVPLPIACTASEDEILADREKVQAATYTQRHFPGARAPVPAAPYIGGVEWDATLYLTAHLDLLNGLLASLQSSAARNAVRGNLRASGFEKLMGCYLRTCKEKFYSGVHDGLRGWVAAAAEDGWEVRYVRDGPTKDEQTTRARSSSPRKGSPKKKAEEAPKIEEAPKLDLVLEVDVKTNGNDDGGQDGWLG